jgi:UDP-2,3-diacylglucosamine pyrophosphatase LpxH
LGGKKAWIFHGDVFDASVQHSKWLARMGGAGYDLLIRLNNLINWGLTGIGKEKYSLSKRIKSSVKKAVKFITNFEDTASELAIENQYDYVICGHIHQPQIRTIANRKGVLTSIQVTGSKTYPHWNTTMENGSFSFMKKRKRSSAITPFRKPYLPMLWMRSSKG